MGMRPSIGRRRGGFKFAAEILAGALLPFEKRGARLLTDQDKPLRSARDLFALAGEPGKVQRHLAIRDILAVFTMLTQFCFQIVIIDNLSQTQSEFSCSLRWTNPAPFDDLGSREASLFRTHGALLTLGLAQLLEQARSAREHARRKDRLARHPFAFECGNDVAGEL